MQTRTNLAASNAENNKEHTTNGSQHAKKRVGQCHAVIFIDCQVQNNHAPTGDRTKPSAASENTSHFYFQVRKVGPRDQKRHQE
jgi:hypothetical protein